MKYQLRSMQVEAEQMTKLAYCQMRGWDVPFDEDPDEVGMLVKYPTHNHVTWVRQEVFAKTYEQVVESTPANRLADELVVLSNNLNKLTVFLEKEQGLVNNGGKPTVGYESLRDLFLEQSLMRELVNVKSGRLRRMTVDNNPL